MATRSTPVTIEHALTLDILRGRYAVASRLPTVRELAARHGVNPATIQRVVARLETRGLVTARQGSGIRVNDPHTSGDVSLLPFWLEATLDDPPRAVAILEDLLDVRRVMAVRLLVRHRPAILAAAPRLGALAAELTNARGVAALRDADMAFARALLRETGNLVALAILNTTDRVLCRLPIVAEAMYADPAANTAAMLEVLQTLMVGAPDASARIEQAMAAIDQQTLHNFAVLLEALAEAER